MGLLDEGVGLDGGRQARALGLLVAAEGPGRQGLSGFGSRRQAVEAALEVRLQPRAGPGYHSEPLRERQLLKRGVEEDL